MKNIIQKIIFLTAIASLSSCKEELDLEPRDTLSPEVAEKQLETFEGLINNAYNTLQIQEYYRSGFLLTSDALSDNVISVETRIFDGQDRNNIGSHFAIWNIYTGINNCNLIINNISNVELANSSELTNVQRLKAEAYFLRGLMYFDLHRAYSYEPNNIVSDWDRGLILRTRPVTSVSEADFRQRSSVEDGYKLIESDLLTAITIFNTEELRGTIYRANLGATHGLLARLYLYWNRWNDALAQVELARTQTSATMVAASDYEESFTLDPHPESLFEIDFQAATDLNFPDKVVGTMRALTNFSDDLSVQFFSVAIPDDLVNIFEAGDVRRDLIKESNVGTNTYNMAFKWLGSEPGEGFTDNIPVLRYSELVLIEAECQFRLGNEDKARSILSGLRTQRGLAVVSNTTTGDNLFDLIMNERRVEFFLEGHRWFDLKRNGMDISKDNGNGIPFSDFRILAGIPLTETLLNENLAQNPGY